MREAWFSASEMIASSLPNSGSKTAPFASKQEENRIVSSVPRKADSACSSSRWRSWVPQMKRTEAMPKPRSSRARLAEATSRSSSARPR